MTKVIMHGCNGKMGQVITGLIAQDEDVKIVAGIDTYDEKSITTSAAIWHSRMVLYTG